MVQTPLLSAGVSPRSDDSGPRKTPLCAAGFSTCDSSMIWSKERKILDWGW